jgi:pseudaminic acid biosynthesis-associated methylase
MWQGEFGTKYIDRNFYAPVELDRAYANDFGMTCSQLHKTFLGRMSRGIRILEVGCNVGNQLVMLQKMGFTNLYGVEINRQAVEKAKARSQGLNVVWGEAQDIPFKDKFFDLVFTAGVLIHIPPSDIKRVMREMVRCSSKYIFGFESYAERYQKVDYRGLKDLYWKTNFCRLFEETCPGLKRQKFQMLKYLSSDQYDAMFLLAKKGAR